MNKQTKPVTQVLLDYKEMQNVEQLATTLETIARKLREQGKFTIVQGEQEVEVQPANHLKVEFKYEVKGDKHSFEVEFDWRTNQETHKMNIL